MTFAPGKVGQAFSFDGSSYVDASDSNLPVGNSSATISSWIKTTQTGEPFFVSWGSRSHGCCPGNEIALGNYNNHLIMESCGGAVREYHHRQRRSMAPRGRSLVWLKHGDALRGRRPANRYSPRRLSRRLTSSHPVISNIGQLVEFGGNFIGLVDEVQIYNRPLSESEIQAIFNAGSAGVCKPEATPSPTPTATATETPTPTATADCNSHSDCDCYATATATQHLQRQRR